MPSKKISVLYIHNLSKSHRHWWKSPKKQSNMICGPNYCIIVKIAVDMCASIWVSFSNLSVVILWECNDIYNKHSFIVMWIYPCDVTLVCVMIICQQYSISLRAYLARNNEIIYILFNLAWSISNFQLVLHRDNYGNNINIYTYWIRQSCFK